VLSPYPALAGLRVGCVKYLNARPLIYGYEGPVRFDHPSGLARELARGGLDAALVPIFEALDGRHYLIADGAAIACDGPVYSVFLAYRGELAAVRTVALDPASLTSVHLLQVLLAEFRGQRPQYVDAAKATGEPDARLLIGNQAIEFRAAAAGAYHYLDLGEEWKRQTGLPFVFAMWLMQPDLPRAGAVAADFRALKRDGVAHIPQIVRGDSEATPEFRRRYLTQHIRFDFGPRERAGVERFRALLVKHGLAVSDGAPLEFV
jgi:chorismate dehydratase